MKYFQFLFLILAVNFVACSSADNTTTTQDTTELPFFNLRAYFKEEATRLNQKKNTVDKIVSINEDAEKRQLNDLDYDAELKAFIDSDINKIAWYEKYQIDSTTNAENTQLTYTAQDPSLKTQSVKISFLKNEVDEIIIENQTESFIAASKQVLIYNPIQGYSINTDQSSKIGEDKAIEIKVKF